MLGWAFALPVLKRTVALPRLVRLMQGNPGADRGRARDRIAALAAWIYDSRFIPARENCLERSLIAYRYLGRADADPELVVGTRRGDTEVLGHVWVLVDGLPVHETDETLAGYVPILSFRGGSLVRRALD